MGWGEHGMGKVWTRKGIGWGGHEMGRVFSGKGMDKGGGGAWNR